MTSQPVSDTVDPQAAALNDATEDTDSVEITPDIDLDSLREDVATAAASAQLQADLNAIKRATGHIPGLQSRLDSVEKAARRVETLEASNKDLAARLDVLVSALVDGSLITPGVAQNLRPVSGDSNAELMARFSELEDRITRGNGPADDQPEIDPAVAAITAQWNEATATVERYAKSKNFESSSIPDAVWQRAMQGNINDPAGAVLEVAKYIDTQVSAESRRADRKDAAAGGSGERATRKGALTLETIKNMSLEEVMAIPAEERNRIMSGA